ncbi:MAG TPA: D-alanine--D-alanine ligase A [Acidobacteria bacterium]|nr:D-alanine--D-alanine ligase A [Acidobacteriota bacterium]MDP6372470.1 D-alanine--D-alanine ligase family protein [Vicinamibacterales bacterium]HAK54258.1 D-alanine--D-alanine ligase A [Acidobacteriota bacterium]
MPRLRIGVLYGGRSGEHEVSLASAAAVIAHLDPDRYEPIAILVGRDGRWSLPNRPPTIVEAADVIQRARLELEAAEPVDAPPLRPPPPRVTEPQAMVQLADGTVAPPVQHLALDIVFPVLHGPYGEDGTVQGLLELADVPYVGAGVLASAVGMDKAVMKVLFGANGLAQVDHRLVRSAAWRDGPAAIRQMIASELGFPLFVKPANLGSSVGISKVKTADDLDAAIALAAQFDRKIVVEAAVPNAREIECAVLGNDDIATSVPGEVVPSREFYDYEAKYLDTGSALRIPAPIEPDEAEEVRRLAEAAFRAVDGCGMARVDFLLNDGTRELFVNELNTIPGFTTISMYAKLWEASGLAYPQLLDRLVELALERHADKKQLRTSAT